MWEADESRKKGGKAVTDDAVNMFGLEITDLIAPARMQGKHNKQLDKKMKNSLDKPEKWSRKKLELSNRLASQKAERVNLKTHEERVAFDDKYPRLTRLNLKNVQAEQSKWVDCNIEGANLEEANLKKAKMIGSTLRTANLFRAKAPESQWIVADVHDVDARGLQAPGSEWFQIEGRYLNLNPAMENGPKDLGRRYIEPSKLHKMWVQHLNYNRADKRWVKANENNFSYMKAQGADFSESQWENMKVSNGDFSRYAPAPPLEFQNLEGYASRRYGDLTGEPIWATIKEPLPTDFNKAQWRNVDAQFANFEGARMTHMRFPAEMTTIDDVIDLKQETKRKRLFKGFDKRSPKNVISFANVEYHQPYLIPTSEIPFSGANLKNTNWAGTCLNAESKITGKVESRLNFEGAMLDGADFRRAKLIDPVSLKEVTLQNLALKISKVDTVETLPDEIFPVIEQMSQIFGSSLEQTKTSPKISMFRYEDKKIASLIATISRGIKGETNHEN